VQQLLPRNGLLVCEKLQVPKPHIFGRCKGSGFACCACHVFPSDLLYLWAIYLFPDGDDACIRTLHSRIGVGDMYTLFRTVDLACCYYMAIVDYVR
jgi:hypothetical protein